MLMMCWFYCVPFAKALFFAFSLLLVLFALFALKRGVCRARPGLRQLSFLLMFTALLKMCTVDVYLLREHLLCTIGSRWCTATGFKMLQGGALVLLLVSSVLLFNIYRGFVRERRVREVMPEENHLFLWTNAGMSLVLLLILWLAAPWFGFLTVGHVPAFFMNVPWQYLAMLETAVLLVGFWKLEDCGWLYDPAATHKKRYETRVWTPKDTLNLSVMLFLIALAFSYVSSDVLSPTTRRSTSSSVPSLSFEDLDRIKGFHMPGRDD